MQATLGPSAVVLPGAWRTTTRTIAVGLAVRGYAHPVLNEVSRCG